MAQSDPRFERAQLLRAAFEPIIDICVQLGVNTSELESLLRVEFVTRVAATLPKNRRTGKGPSHEEVSLAAGLDRGEVQSIRAKGRKSAQLRMSKKSRQHSKSARVLDLWKSDSRFLNSSGGPLALPVENQASGPSFEDLAAQALPHSNYAHVLKDLRRRGLVQVTDDIVRIRRTARPLPSELNSQALTYIAEQMRLVGASLLQSILKPSTPGNESLSLVAASEPLTLPVEDLERVRGELQEHLNHFVQDTERDFSRRAKGHKSKGVSLVIGANAYTLPNR